jgi:hypothetical protein
MSASYEARLLLQCLNLFFFVHLLFSCALLAFTPFGVSAAERVRPATGVRLLLLLRVFPVLAALYAAIAIALPSYLRLESNTESERIGVWGICFAAFSISLWIRPLIRTIRALSRSAQFVKEARQMAQPSNVASSPVWLLGNGGPRIAVAGLFRPRVLLSESVLRIFSQEELDVVLLHEQAHQQSRDNLRRLLLLLFPDALPFVSFAHSLDKACKRLVEWAADDYASAGDSRSSITLARALVCFARHQPRGSACTLATSLVDDTCDLARRVERLLSPRQTAPSGARTYAACAVLIAASTVIFAAAIHSAGLPNIHRLLEFLSH